MFHTCSVNPYIKKRAYNAQKIHQNSGFFFTYLSTELPSPIISSNFFYLKGLVKRVRRSNGIRLEKYDFTLCLKNRRQSGWRKLNLLQFTEALKEFSQNERDGMARKPDTHVKDQHRNKSLQIGRWRRRGLRWLWDAFSEGNADRLFPGLRDWKEYQTDKKESRSVSDDLYPSNLPENV